VTLREAKEVAVGVFYGLALFSSVVLAVPPLLYVIGKWTKYWLG
jgi:hypothetical protein